MATITSKARAPVKAEGGAWWSWGLRLTSRPGSGSRFVLHTSGSGHLWNTLFQHDLLSAGLLRTALTMLSACSDVRPKVNHASVDRLNIHPREVPMYPVVRAGV